jgi:dihydropteroate synthase
MFSFAELCQKKKKPIVMGILNVTPDSFYDGGRAFSVDAIISKVNTLCAEGADIIDVGACSTAPGNALASEEEELARVECFLPCILKHSTVPVSIDTFRPAVAEYAASLGVHIINDESGCFKNEMAEVIKKYGCGWIFMHTGNSSSNDTVKYSKGVVADVLSFFSKMRRQAIAFGIPSECLCYDCGIGFGKSREDDISLLASCDIMTRFSPLLVGASRKRVIGELTGISDPSQRLEGSVAVAKILAEDGVGILRVHDVEETVKAVKGL